MVPPVKTAGAAIQSKRELEVRLTGRTSTAKISWASMAAEVWRRTRWTRQATTSADARQNTVAAIKTTATNRRLGFISVSSSGFGTTGKSNDSAECLR